MWLWDGGLFEEAVLNEDPNGELNSVTVNVRFPDQYHEMETGLAYNNYFRDFDPITGGSLAVQKSAQYGGGGIRW